MKAGVIGTGHLGKIHAKLWKEVEGAELVGLYDVNTAEAERVASELGVRAFTTIDDIIAAADGLSIVTPTVTHFEVAKKAIEAGKPVLIEKPITTTIEEADELITLAKTKRVKIQVGHIERFNPALMAVEPYISDPRFFESHRLAQFKPRGTDVAVVLDLMIHDIDIILSLVKSPVKSVDASGVAVVSDEIDIANARLTFENGAVANVTASRISQTPMRKLRIFGRDAYVSVDFASKNSEVFRLVSPDAARTSSSLMFNLGEIDRAEKKLNIIYEKSEVKDSNPLRFELEQFCSVVKGIESPTVSGEDGVAALRVAERILKAIKG